MRVLLYSESFDPKVGGPVTVTRLLASYLHQQGIGVVVATRTPGPPGSVGSYQIERDCSAERLRALVRGADLVHFHTFHRELMWLALRARRKVVTTYHGLTSICPKGTKWKSEGRPCTQTAFPTMCARCLRAAGLPVIRLLRPPLKVALSRMIHANVCPSRFGLLRLPLHRLRVIPNGVDTDFFVPSAFRAPNRDAQVLLVARLIPEKGGDLLLRAASICRREGRTFHLSICGDGPDRTRLEELTRQEGLETVVTFRGALRGDHLLRAMQQADIAVVPSRSEETFGLTAVEAMSCGLAVVGADVGGLGEIVSAAGLSFPGDDVPSLASQLNRLLSNPDLQRELGKAGRELATTRYDWRIMGASYLRLYRELLGAA